MYCVGEKRSYLSAPGGLPVKPFGRVVGEPCKGAENVTNNPVRRYTSSPLPVPTRPLPQLQKERDEIFSKFADLKFL